MHAIANHAEMVASVFKFHKHLDIDANVLEPAIGGAIANANAQIYTKIKW